LRLLSLFCDEVGAERPVEDRRGYVPGVLLIAATERELEGLVRVGRRSLVCGIGPVEAAAATARALAEERPRGVLHIGLAGTHGFSAPELVVGSEAVYCDPDSSLVPTRSTPDTRLVETVRAALPEARLSPIGTSARVGGTSGCGVEAMEGFGVLRACELAGVPAVELRAVSNEITEPDRSLWQFDEALALLRAGVCVVLEALDA
jgi:nucleoside phosphorylase